MTARRTAAYPPARLYEAILHLRRLGYSVSCHDRRRGLHRLDEVILTDEALLERAMGTFRPKPVSRIEPPAPSETGELVQA